MEKKLFFATLDHVKQHVSAVTIEQLIGLSHLSIILLSQRARPGTNHG